MARIRSLNVEAGQLQVRQDGDFVEPNPSDLTFTYLPDGRLDTITGPIGVKTFTYAGGRLSTISDTASGRVSTFNYTGSSLSSITITNI